MRPSQRLRADSASGKQSRPASGEETWRAKSDLARLAADATSCQRCPLYRNATQVVFGEGPVGAALVMIGEQPGDQEDRTGRPFVGPAGRVLDQALSAVGLDRRAVYVTNAVKHFKHEKRGKRRLHKHPNSRRRWYGAGGEGVALSALFNNPMERPMLQSNDLSRSFTALNQDTTLIVVIEMSQSIWLVAGMIPGVERQPLKKLNPDEDQLLKLMNRWRYEALRAGHAIERVVVAYEAGRDGFWLARWLRERGVEAYVIHPSSIAVSREHRRAKTDRLDTELLMRAFLGWLRGERRHCSMAAIPTIEEEDAKRPDREHEKLVGDRTRIINRMKSMLSRLGVSEGSSPLYARPMKSSANCAPPKERFCLKIRVLSFVAT